MPFKQKKSYGDKQREKQAAKKAAKEIFNGYTKAERAQIQRELEAEAGGEEEPAPRGSQFPIPTVYTYSAASVYNRYYSTGNLNWQPNFIAQAPVQAMPEPEVSDVDFEE